MSWCKDFKLRMVVTAVPGAGHQLHPAATSSSTSTSGSTGLESPGGVSTALIQGDDEAEALIELRPSATRTRS